MFLVSCVAAKAQPQMVEVLSMWANMGVAELGGLVPRPSTHAHAPSKKGHVWMEGRIVFFPPQSIPQSIGNYAKYYGSAAMY